MPFQEALGIAAPDWQGRLREAAYTSPGGTRIKFDYVETSRETEKRTAPFTFGGLNGVYIQDNGYSGREYPLRCLFWGPEHDRVSTAFESALLERGPGTLEHPVHGRFSAIPLGKIARRNDLVQAANQTVVEVTFSTTLADVFPSGGVAPGTEIDNEIAGFNVAAAQQWTASTDLSTLGNKASIKSQIQDMIGEVSSTLQDMADVTANIKRGFDANVRAINGGIDVLIGQPLNLARQILGVIQAPGRALAGLQSRFEAYGRLLDRLFGAAPGKQDGSTNSVWRTRAKNEFWTSDLFILGAISGLVISSRSTDHRSKSSALEAALKIIEQRDRAVSWRETRLETLVEVDTGDSYQAIESSVALTTAYLVDLSFSLPPERSLVTDRARTPIDLCAQLYRSVSDERLQFLIDSNKLSGAEILEVPRGRTIVWYS